MSEDTGRSIDAKIAEVALQFGRFGFDGKNDFSNYKYTSAAQIVEAVRKPLCEAGLSVAAQSRVENSEWTPKGSHLVIVSVTLCITDSESNESRVWSGVGSGADKGDKAVMKATTAALKYALATSLLLSWGVTDDPEADTSTDRDHSDKKPSRAKKVASGGNDEEFAAVMKSIEAGEDVPKSKVRTFREHPKFVDMVNAHKAAAAKKE